jgi:hypothetical protein
VFFAVILELHEHSTIRAASDFAAKRETFGHQNTGSGSAATTVAVSASALRSSPIVFNDFKFIVTSPFYFTFLVNFSRHHIKMVRVDAHTEAASVVAMMPRRTRLVANYLTSERMSTHRLTFPDPEGAIPLLVTLTA